MRQLFFRFYSMLMCNRHEIEVPSQMWCVARWSQASSAYLLWLSVMSPALLSTNDHSISPLEPLWWPTVMQIPQRDRSLGVYSMWSENDVTTLQWIDLQIQIQGMLIVRYTSALLLMYEIYTCTYLTAMVNAVILNNSVEKFIFHQFLNRFFHQLSTLFFVVID